MNIEEVWKKIFPRYIKCFSYRELSRNYPLTNKVCTGYIGDEEFEKYCKDCPKWDGRRRTVSKYDL